MGVFESTIHFDNLTGIIDNQSSYELRYKVTGPVDSVPQDPPSTHQKLVQEQTFPDDTENYVYAGLVMPYSTKYFQFKQIENQYRFSVFASKINQQEKQQIVPLEKDIKIISQTSICIRITPQLKVIHLSVDEIKKLQLRKSIESIFIKSSTIVKSSEFSHRLVGFFKNYPSNAKLLFKASEKNFDVRNFYDQYGLCKNVLLICKTNKNKTIGGYSKNSFICPQQKNYDEKGWKNIHDKTNSSFIFSLSCNDVFKLRQSQNALFYNKNQEQICFGSDELRINNHSDKNICLTQNLNTNYENHNYNNDSDSYKLLNGNQSPQFTTKQWEVWGLQFQDQQQEQENAFLASDI